MKANQTVEIEQIIHEEVPAFFFVTLAVDAVGKSKPSKILPLIDIIARQNGLNINVSREYDIVMNVLDKSVLRN